jgi:hypothetical protein
VTQETATDHVRHAPTAPVAMPWRRPLAVLRGQYITAVHPLGTLMRHYFLPPALAVAPLAPGMGQTPTGRGLIALGGRALHRAPGLIAAARAAVALAPVAVRAHQHHAVAMQARECSCAPELPTRHWHYSPWSPECPPWRTRPSAGLDGTPVQQFARTRVHSWLTRWGAPADNNLPVIAAVAPVLFDNSAVLPLVRPHANTPAMPGLVCLVRRLLRGKASTTAT